MTEAPTYFVWMVEDTCEVLITTDPGYNATPAGRALMKLERRGEYFDHDSAMIAAKSCKSKLQYTIVDLTDCENMHAVQARTGLELIQAAIAARHDTEMLLYDDPLSYGYEILLNHMKSARDLLLKHTRAKDVPPSSTMPAYSLVEAVLCKLIHRIFVYAMTKKLNLVDSLMEYIYREKTAS